MHAHSKSRGLKQTVYCCVRVPNLPIGIRHASPVIKGAHLTRLRPSMPSNGENKKQAERPNRTEQNRTAQTTGRSISLI